jgi:hypothetical protein
MFVLTDTFDRDALMEECVRMMQQHLRAPTTKKRAKTVYAQKNLGTIRDKKRQRRQEKEKQETNGSEVIMRILRMRCVFIADPRRFTCFETCVQTGYHRLFSPANADYDVTDAKRAGETNKTDPTPAKPTPTGPVLKCRPATYADGTPNLIVILILIPSFHCCSFVRAQYPACIFIARLKGQLEI